ncbi:MAG: S46 family peptidase, partial [Luteibaculum sp.]
AMSGDISFETQIQRTICVDARYIVFVMDKFAGANNLVNELKLVEKPVQTLAPKAKAEENEEVELGMSN